MSQNERVHWIQVEEVHRSEQQHALRQDYLHQEVETLLVEYAVHALGEEDRGDGPAQGEGEDRLVPGEVDPADTEDEDAEVGRRRLPRERPFTLPQLIRRAHEGLGHPSNDRLATWMNRGVAKSYKLYRTCYLFAKQISIKAKCLAKWLA